MKPLPLHFHYLMSYYRGPTFLKEKFRSIPWRLEESRRSDHPDTVYVAINFFHGWFKSFPEAKRAYAKSHRR